MYDSEETNPQIWNFFKEGGFTIQTGKIPFTAFGEDQAQEHVNKIYKGEGGISGITTSPEAPLRTTNKAQPQALAHQNLPDCLLKQRSC